MNKVKIILIIILLIIINTKSYSKEKIFIVYNINNELITNVDIKKESVYLTALNDQLKNLDEKIVLDIAKESIVRETIKRIELSKYFDLDKPTAITDDYIKSFYLRLNLKDEKEFNKYLQSYGLSNSYIRKKIQIESSWNRLIYDKYIDLVKTNKKKISKEIASNKSKVDEKVYLLSEIVFEINNQDDLSKKKIDIFKSIKEIGFKNSANIYSISNSSKFGGEIGWIEEKKLSKKIYTEINKLKINDYTNPILVGSTYLILKINDIKFEKKITNIAKEVNRKIEFEKNRQLEQYSKLYYNKIKINTSINEL